MAKRCRLQRVGLVHGQVLSERRQERFPDRVRSVDCPDDSPGPQAMRRRADPGERDEAGGQPATSRTADAVARHYDQHQPDKFRADQAGPDEALRRRALRSIRSDPDRRGRLIGVGAKSLLSTLLNSLDWPQASAGFLGKIERRQMAAAWA